MGYDYEDAWNELKGLLHEPKPDEETATPLNDKARKWIRNKMSDIEKNLTTEER